jgi:hypothetical protein
MLFSLEPFIFGDSSSMVTSLGGEGKMFGVISHGLGRGIGHDCSVVFGDWNPVHGGDEEGELFTCLHYCLSHIYKISYLLYFIITIILSNVCFL